MDNNKNQIHCAMILSVLFILSIALLPLIAYASSANTILQGSNTLQITLHTPYVQFKGAKLYRLGIVQENYNKIISPCTSPNTTGYTDGIYNCQRSASAPAHTSGLGITSINTRESANWAGYAYATNVPSISAVQGSWVIQTASPLANFSTYSSQWTGLGGYVMGDNTLIQVGTQSDDYYGATSYAAWYELIPAPAVEISGFSVYPGDIVNASISAMPNAINEWNITLIDETDKDGFSAIVNYTSSQLSADWVDERPTVCRGGCSTALLTKFGASYYGAQYTGVSGTESVNSSQGPQSLGSLNNVTPIVMYLKSTYLIAQPSPLTDQGTSFNVTELNNTIAYFNSSDITLSAPYNSLDLAQAENLSVEINGGVPPYKYHWLENKDHIVGTNSVMVKWKALGTYNMTVEVTDSLSHSATARLSITVYPKLAIRHPSLIISDKTLQLGDSEDIYANIAGGTGNYAYQWTVSGAPVADNSNALDFTASSYGSAKIAVAVTDSAGNRVFGSGTIKVEKPGK